MTFAAAMAFVLLVGPASQQPQPAPPAQKPPAFRSGVELLAVDVSVVDRDGQPVDGLGPVDFSVEIGGKRRNVVRAEFIEFTRSAGAVPELADVSSNQADSAAPEPRTILLLVDDLAFAPSEGKAVFMKLADSVERLFPRDPLGFAPLSGRGASVEFTTDRKAVADALRRLMGARSPTLGGSALVNLALAEAVEIARGDTNTLATVVARECVGATGPSAEACRNDVESEARTLVDEAQREAQESLIALSRIFDRMAAVPGTKYVLFVSPGIALGAESGLALDVARSAAAAGVTLHAFYVERSDMADVTRRRVSPRSLDDTRMRADGLQLAVDASGGAMHRVLGDPTRAFERVRREMSAVYRLGVELEAVDADGRTREIEVKAKRPGVTTRSHRHVIAPRSHATSSPAERLKRSLESPLVDRDLGVRLGTFAFRDDGGRGALVIAAEADTAATGLRVAFVVRDPRGRTEAAGELGPEAVITEKDAPPLVIFRAAVPPGDHTVKIALVDAEGRAGSAVRAASVSGGVPQTFALGDLIVLPDGKDALRARPSARIAQGSRQASVYFELYAGRASPQRTPLVLEIADAPEAPALVSTRSTISLRTRGAMARAAGQMRFSPAALPPGRYFARLAVEGSDVRAVRGFSIVSGSAAALLSDESRALVPLFNVSRFLSEPLLRAVAIRLERDAGGNAALADVARALAAGSWRDVQPATGDAVADATLRGLQALGSGQAADAERAFREALDADPEFTLALALAGGAWASVGRDREASRSWRTSLATGIDAPFLHQHVAEALLRSGDVKGTRGFLAELEETGADTARLARARALAAAISGDRKQAAAALGEWVDANPDDHEAAFLLALALYESKTVDKDASVAAEFERRAKQYIAANGPRRALVARWLK